MKKAFFNTFTIICTIAILICSLLLVKTLYDYKKENDLYQNIKVEAYKHSKVDFKSLKKKNSEVIGWITVPGTRIDYPIVQTSDNDKYIHTLFDGKQGGAGCIFADCRGDPFNDTLTIIYGHRMKDGSMFNNLKYYKDYSFAKNHNKITLYTPSKTYNCKIVTFATIRADNNIYNKYFTSAYDVCHELKEHTSYTYNTVSDKDKLIALSTCTYEFKNARYVLLAKLNT